MLKDKIRKEGLDCCVVEVSEMMQGLVRTLHLFEKMQISSKGFTNSQCYTLLNIFKNVSLTMSELSEKMNLDTSTMTRIVNNLVRDGYIKREKSSEDRRIVLVKLTDKGLKETKELNSDVIDYYRTIIKEIPEGKVLEVVESMNILTNVLMKVKSKCC